MEDADVEVAAAAAGRSLVSAGPEALDRLHRLLRDGDPEVRRAALGGLSLAPDEIAADLAAELLADADPEVRAAALARIAVVPERALGPSVAAISDPDPVVRRAAGRTLGACGPAAVEHVLNALADPGMIEPGIEAARRLRAVGREGAVRDFARITGRQVRDDAALLGSLSGNDDAERLLRDAILERCRRVARSGLWALTTVAREPTAMAVAIDHLDGRSEQVPEALETLEASSRDRADVRPLLEPWEPIRVQDGTGRLPLDDEDDTIRRCAELVRLRREGGTMTTASSLPALERVLVLRRVPLFEALAPGDLEKVAEIAEERGYADGETLAVEGELGDELHIVTGGTIRVVQLRGGAEHELARRTAGEVVGEMSLLTRAPRVASLIADGPVRTLRIGDRAFASMLRERPSVALELLRVLAQRLSDATPATEDLSHFASRLVG